MAFKVWIDQDECIGNGICAELCPELFIIEGGIAYVRGAESVVTVAPHLEAAVIEAAECCPAECIYVESIADD